MCIQQINSTLLLTIQEYTQQSEHLGAISTVVCY
jgi:hypothetical protein